MKSEQPRRSAQGQKVGEQQGGALDARAARRSEGRPPREVLKQGSHYYVLASSMASRREVRVLASAKSFAVFDICGDIPQAALEPLGFFYRDTRYLSRFDLRIAGKSPYFLNSFQAEDYAELRVNLTNADMYGGDGAIKLPRDSVQIDRRWVLDDAAVVHQLMLRNYTLGAVSLQVQLAFDVDFADLFEVRGVRRQRRGSYTPPEVVGDDDVTFRYLGLDQIARQTRVHFEPAPQALERRRAIYRLRLDPGEQVELQATISGAGSKERARLSPATLVDQGFRGALERRRTQAGVIGAQWAAITLDNPRFGRLVKRSTQDLTAMYARTEEGGFLMGGIPWFATLFGRDSLIAAMSLLPFNPELASDTLRTLARLQGVRIDDVRDEQPGKIVHEIRQGEMAATGEVPFGRYYGSVDSTPLFLWVLAQCVEVTGELELAEELWPAVLRALEWIERWGDRDGDGYIEYERTTTEGLANQGWKDSWDAISHRDGELARPPIALAEVQGYVYAAFEGIARLAGRLEKRELADRLRERAERLRQAFNRDFWLEKERLVALALDGDKKPCQVEASNGAHCLATGILEKDRARDLTQRLLSEGMFTGWGIRTLGARERRFNPMSYHNGSVWPHDNAIGALGFARYGEYDAARTVLKGLFEAALEIKKGSLPELFCGFAREQGAAPVPYPVACYPQSWSAASVHLMLRAALGLEVNGGDGCVAIGAKALPDSINEIGFKGLRVGRHRVSFTVRRSDVGMELQSVEKPESVAIELRH